MCFPHLPQLYIWFIQQFCAQHYCIFTQFERKMWKWTIRVGWSGAHAHSQHIFHSHTVENTSTSTWLRVKRIVFHIWHLMDRRQSCIAWHTHIATNPHIQNKHIQQWQMSPRISNTQCSLSRSVQLSIHCQNSFTKFDTYENNTKTHITSQK